MGEEEDRYVGGDGGGGRGARKGGKRGSFLSLFPSDGRSLCRSPLPSSFSMLRVKKARREEEEREKEEEGEKRRSSITQGQKRGKGGGGGNVCGYSGLSAHALPIGRSCADGGKKWRRKSRKIFPSSFFSVSPLDSSLKME